MFSISTVTEPEFEPLTVAQAKAHLYVDDDASDQIIAALIKVARLKIEGETHRALVQRTLDLEIDGGWPMRGCMPYIALPVNPVASVTSVTYVDGSSPEPTLAAANYTATLRNNASYIVPAYSVTWPTVRNVPGAVKVRFVAGYADVDSIPEPLVQAMKLYVAHLFYHRGDEAKPLPPTIEALVSPYRASRLRS